MTEEVWHDIEIDDDLHAELYRLGYIKPVITWRATPKFDEIIKAAASVEGEE